MVTRNNNICPTVVCKGVMILLGLGSRDCVRSTQMHGQTAREHVLAAPQANQQ